VPTLTNGVRREAYGRRMELAGGALIFGLFLVVFTAAVIYGLYTRRGSGIDEHPYGNPYDAASSSRAGGGGGREGIADWSRGTR
jgi:hypothetical protein